ncbi:hypothetical protein HGT70_14785 [Rosenbergiella collisarenosi]|uniref:hypothetical protein n=1 Tax=Rosenbergiella collisarenosi TaxID=1544695 RepID=UPI001BD9AA2F|nr:hypothetical protein [Rosenbergiella collisarenosi]MBT0722530.1 hypothetical protein [Rosenbergiella collisarenosi]
MNNSATEAVITALFFGGLWFVFMYFCSKRGWNKQPLKFTFICLVAGVAGALLTWGFKYALHYYLG